MARNILQPDLLNLVENSLQHGEKIKSSSMKNLFQDVLSVAVDNGLNDNELELLLKFFRLGNVGMTYKVKLLQSLVPTHVVPAKAMLDFMVWFIFSYKRNMSTKTSTSILQWISALLENGFLDPTIIDVFYFDFYYMLKFEKLRKYACKLICRLTKPYDVTSSHVLSIIKYNDVSDASHQKFLCAVLNVFKGFKPHLVPEQSYKKVNVESVLSLLPQHMDSFIKCLRRKQDLNLVIRDFGVFAATQPVPTRSVLNPHRLSSLVPFPSYDLEGLDKVVACYPQSIEETFRRFRRVPIPQNIMSLLRNEVGLFLIMFSNADVQRRISKVLLGHLDGVLVRKDVTAPDDDVEFLLSQVYKLEMFMQQGLPCVSIFLSGYLLIWDGLDHRSQVLKLIEWATFKSFKELSGLVLRPLYMLFVSSENSMKQQILHTVTNLIRNMYLADVQRVTQNLRHPFMAAPLWTQEPLAMLEPLVMWVDGLIKLSCILKPIDSSLLLECVHFYEMMDILESRCLLPMWTIVSCTVVYHSLMNITPIALNRVCRLLLKYHQSFLPMLHETKPEFYNTCLDKINLTTKYIKEIINLLWDGQAFSKKEDGVIMKMLSEQDLQRYREQIDLDKSFVITNNVSFFPFAMKVKEENGRDVLQSKMDYLIMLEYFTPDIAAFIRYFSDSFQPQ